MVKRIDVTLSELHDLRGQIDRKDLDEGAWLVVGALVSSYIARAEARQERPAAKIRAAAEGADAA